MNKIIYTLLVSLTIITNNANALSMMGSRSCGQWVTTKEKNNQQSIGNLAWFIGFINGIAVISNKDFLKGTDGDSIEIWVDNYCKTYPLKRLDDAGLDLSLELVRKKGL